MKIKAGWRWYGGSALILLLSLCLLVYRSSDRPEAVASVNGHPVVRAQFEQVMLLHRGPVRSYFRSAYGAEDGPDFWTTAYEGQAPIDRVRQLALDDLVKIVIQQLAAKERGVVRDIRYDGLMRQMERDNERRRKAVERQEIIYGPVAYTAHTYFEYVFSNMVIQLKNKLAEEGFFSRPDDFAERDREYEVWLEKRVREAHVVVHEQAYERTGW